MSVIPLKADIHHSAIAYTRALSARLLAKRSRPSEGCLRRSGQRAPRRHRAVKGLFESRDQVLLRLGGDIEPAISVGEAFCVDEALLTRPREIRGSIADDVDGQLLSSRMELFADAARRPSARLFA